MNNILRLLTAAIVFGVVIWAAWLLASRCEGWLLIAGLMCCGVLVWAGLDLLVGGADV